MKQLIYNNTVSFQFDEGEHLYQVSKLVDPINDLWTTPTPVMGVTSVTGIIAKPALVGWAAGLSANFLKDNLKDIKDLPRLADEAKRQHIMEANKGKATGSVGHSLVEKLLKGEPVTMPTQPEPLKAATSVTQAFTKWSQDFMPEVVAIEQACYSLQHDYAGKFDLLCNIGDKLILVDFKTNNVSRYAPEGIYPDMFCQLGAYMQLIKEQMGVEVDDAMIVNLPKAGSQYKVKSLSEIGVRPTEASLYFLNALGLYKLNRDITYKLKT